MKNEDKNDANPNSETNHLASVHSGEVVVKQEEVKKEEVDINALAKIHEQGTKQEEVKGTDSEGN